MSLPFNIFNDIVKLLDGITEMEQPFMDMFKTGSQFLEDFKSGKVEATQKDCDQFVQELGAVEKVFSSDMLPSVMDMYQKLKVVLGEHKELVEKNKHLIT